MSCRVQSVLRVAVLSALSIVVAASSGCSLVFETSAKGDAGGQGIADGGPPIDARDTVPGAVSNLEHRAATPAVAWSGENLGVAWANASATGTNIYFALMSVDGETVVEPFPITAPQGSVSAPTIVWTGTEFVVVWDDDSEGSRELFYARLDANATVLVATRVPSLDASTSRNATIAYMGGRRLGIAWEDARTDSPQAFEVFFTVMELDTGAIGPEKRLTALGAGSQAPSMVWNGTNFMLLWVARGDEGTSDIYQASITSEGEFLPATGPEVVSTSEQPSAPFLVWNDRDYAAAWVSFNASASAIVFLLLDENGLPSSPEVTVSTEKNAANANLVWDGTQYWLSWNQVPGSAPEVFQRQIAADATSPNAGVQITNHNEGAFHPAQAATGGPTPSLVWQDHRDGVQAILLDVP